MERKKIFKWLAYGKGKKKKNNRTSYHTATAAARWVRSLCHSWFLSLSVNSKEKNKKPPKKSSPCLKVKVYISYRARSKWCSI